MIKMDKKLPFVALQLTKNCNLNCQFCFRRLNFEEVSPEDMQKVLLKISEMNPEKIVLSGGEPLLRQDIKDILITLKNKGINTILQSNGLLLPDIIEDIDKYVDYYSLSLDGDCEETNKVMRGPNQLKKVIDSLNKIKKLNKPVKLGTIVSSKNIDNIIGIGNLLKGKVTVWKLYQFYGRKNCIAEKNEKEFVIDNNSFNNIISILKKKYPEINISSHSVEEFAKGPCVLIHPDGNVHLTKGKKDILIGNIFKKDPKQIKKEICSMEAYEYIIKNYLKTYKKDVVK